LKSENRLEQRVHRPAERAGLLAGDDGDRRGIGQAGGGRARRGRGAALVLLAGDEIRDARAVARVLLSPAHGVAPRRAVQRIPRVQSFDLFEVVRVVSRERPDPREAADVDARDVQAACGLGGSGRLGGHGVVLSQSGWKAVKATDMARRFRRARAVVGSPIRVKFS
jgi:hypothetical protein